MKNILQYIIENQSINFGKMNSNYGQCIIFAGGPGSGKGWVKNHRVLAQFKSVDVDDFKTMYIKMQKAGKIKDDDKEYKISNPDDLDQLHSKVKQHGWKKKQRAMFWNQKHKHQEEKGFNNHLPNILWDMVSDEVGDLEEIIKMAKPLGYQITLVWVVANIDTARENNKHRERHVKDAIIVKGHTGVRDVMLRLFGNKLPDVADAIDRAWIAYSPGKGRKLTGVYAESPVIRIRKNNDGKFIFDKKAEVIKFLDQQMPFDTDDEKKAQKEKERKANNEAIRQRHKEWQDEFERKRKTNENGLGVLVNMIKEEILN